MGKKLKKVYNIFANNILSKDNVIFVSEDVDWVIKDICLNIKNVLNKIGKIKVGLAYSHFLFRNKVIHFGSIGTLVRGDRLYKIYKSNKVVLTWFHIEPEDKRVKYIKQLNNSVDILHTACQKTRADLIKHGFDEKKIVIVPIGIDLDNFKVFSKEKKEEIKKKLGIPKNKIIVGSFQKDGVGWGEGSNPKLVKGPDIFCDVVERLSKQYDIHALLTGPARGYVKERLTAVDIGYTHNYLKNYDDIVDYYNVLDLYLITSRVEGGPKAFLESMACKIPFVSTNVGMVADIIRDRVNGLVSESFEAEDLFLKAKELLDNRNLRKMLVEQGFEDVKRYDWNEIANQYYEKLYLPLMN